MIFYQYFVFLSREKWTTYRLVEDISEDEQEDSAEEAHGSNGDIQTVGLLVHPRSDDADANEPSSLDDQEADCLGDRAALRKSHKDRLAQDVGKLGKDEVVGSCTILDVEETPFVQGCGIRVQDICRVLVQRDGAFRDPNDLERSPDESGRHGDEVENGDYDFSGRVSHRQLPQAENGHLSVGDQNLILRISIRTW